MNESTKPEERPTRDTYLAVIRLLVGLTCHELHSLRMYDIPSEQRRRRGVEPVFPSKEGGRVKLASPYMTRTEAGLRPTVAVAVSRRDWAALSRYVSWRWSVDILPQVLGNAIRCGVVRKAERLVAADFSGHGAWHSAASWDSWLKNRLVEIRSFLPGEPANFAQLRMGVTLHVGFLSIEETEEHLERLRNEKVVESPGPSTPGIERCQTVVGPIDRTSARVVAGSGVGQ